MFVGLVDLGFEGLEVCLPLVLGTPTGSFSICHFEYFLSGFKVFGLLSGDDYSIADFNEM